MAGITVTAGADPEAGVRNHERRTPPELWLTLLAVGAIAFGAAFVEVAVLGIRKVVFDEMLRVSRQVVWMAPLGELLFLLPLYAMLYLAGLRWPRLRSLRSTLTLTLFVALSSVLLSLRLLHDVAIILLAGGAAWQLAPRLARDTERLRRGVRVVVPALAAVFFSLGVIVNGSIAVRERAALADLPAARTGATNVILIIWDTVRAASLRMYGGRARTPNLELLAERGVTFDRAVATAPWTLPSHASIFTGRPHHELDVGWTKPLGHDELTLAEALAADGYRSGAFAANVLYVQWESGLMQGFTRFEDYRITPGQIFISTGLGRRLAQGKHGWETGLATRLVGYRDFVGRKRADQVNHSALQWISSDTTRPYFAFLNYFDAHLPFMPPPPFAGRLGVQRAQPNFVERVRREFERDGYWDMPLDELAGELAAYEESIEYLDHALGVLLEQLEQRGELDNTLIIVTSDHGEEFGEHGDFEHGTNLYMEQLHVPLVVSLPAQIPQGVRITEPVSVRNLAATIANLASLPDSMQLSGTSLVGSTAMSAATAPVYSSLTPGRRPDDRMHAVVSDRYHFIRNTTGVVELYDWMSDPIEKQDIVATPTGRSIAAGLAAQLDRALRCTPRRDPPLGGKVSECGQ